MSFTIDVDAAIEEATSRDTFDVLEFVQGSNTPEQTITVYTDADAALKLAHIFIEEAARSKQASEESLGLTDEDEYEGADEAEINELHERLSASALIFRLKGLAPAAVRALESHLKATTDYKEGAENEEFTEAFNNSLIAKTIKSVERPDGSVSTTAWTAETVGKLNESLYVSEANKLFNGAAEVNFVGAIFDRAVNADFS